MRAEPTTKPTATQDGRTFATEEDAARYVARMAEIGPRKYGARIVALRTRDGLTQAQLARRVGLSYQRISDLEVDRRASVRLDVVYDLAWAMGWDPADLDDRFASRAGLARREKSAKKPDKAT